MQPSPQPAPYDILVVDDNRLIRTMAIRTVRMSNLPVGQVHEASNGREALAVVRDRRIDLVLLDINMPEMDGEEFLTELRADAKVKGTPVVVVSTESNVQRIARLRALGAAFIHKPFKPEELVTAVERLMAFGRRDAGSTP